MNINSLTLANEALEQKDLQIQELTKKLQSTQLSLKMLQHQVEQLLRRVYGKRSEKIDPRQMMFDGLILESLDQPLPQTAPAIISEQEVERKNPALSKEIIRAVFLYLNIWNGWR